MADKKAYTVNPDKKVITIDESVKMSDRDDKDITRYMSVGYTIRYKSKDRVKKATERAQADNLTDKAILEALNGDEKKKAEYIKVKKEGGFFKAKSWYKKNCQ